MDAPNKNPFGNLKSIIDIIKQMQDKTKLFAKVVTITYFISFVGILIFALNCVQSPPASMGTDFLPPSFACLLWPGFWVFPANIAISIIYIALHVGITSISLYAISMILAALVNSVFLYYIVYLIANIAKKIGYKKVFIAFVIGLIVVSTYMYIKYLDETRYVRGGPAFQPTVRIVK